MFHEIETLMPGSTGACSLVKTTLIQFQSRDLTCECSSAMKNAIL